MHRDLKPDNLLIAHDGHVKVITTGELILYNIRPSKCFVDAMQCDIVEIIVFSYLNLIKEN